MRPAEKPDLVIEQYQNASNLEARIELHERFSTSAQGWPSWVFEQLDLPPVCRILDLGCGTGVLWHENLERIPTGWSVALCDRSQGMISRAGANLSQGDQLFSFAVADAGAIPFADGRFDAVIANHMLYHVADLQETLSEIARVLKPGGVFFAATNGEDHLRELDDLTPDFIPQEQAGTAVLNFTLENGAGLIRPFFSDVEQHLFEDSLQVTEAAPLVNYQLSVISMFDTQAQVTAAERQAFEEHVSRIMSRQGGVIPITKNSGLFIANNG